MPAQRRLMGSSSASHGGDGAALRMVDENEHRLHRAGEMPRHGEALPARRAPRAGEGRMETAATAHEDWIGRAAPSPRCPVEAALAVLDSRWKTLIVWRLFWGARPFCELMRGTEGITKKTLRHQLAELERHGLVRRRKRPGGHRQAEYALTPFGDTLKPIVGQLYVFGLRLLDEPTGLRIQLDGAGIS